MPSFVIFTTQGEETPKAFTGDLPNRRVITAQGKPGISMFIFPDRKDAGDLPRNI